MIGDQAVELTIDSFAALNQEVARLTEENTKLGAINGDLNDLVAKVIMTGATLAEEKASLATENEKLRKTVDEQECDLNELHDCVDEAHDMLGSRGIELANARQLNDFIGRQFASFVWCTRFISVTLAIGAVAIALAHVYLW
jgi:regulator of replication initiation timing